MMTDNCVANASGMLACKLSTERVQELISVIPGASKLTVTCLNGVGECVVGGPLGEIDTFQKECKTRKVKVKLLDVPYAFHSPAMDPVLEPLKALGRTITFAQPTIPVFSNVFGRLFEEGDFSSDYFALHARQPVRFAACLLDLQSKELLDGTVFLEVGPQPTTVSMIRSSIHSDGCTYLSSLQKGQDAWESLSSMLAAMSLLKAPVDWREVFVGTSAKVVSLPSHPLSGSTYLIPYQEPRQPVHTITQPPVELRTKTQFELLPWVSSQGSSKDKLALETTLAILEPLISGHDVGGTPICPASVFHELALEGAHTMLAPLESQSLVVTGMTFASPLVYLPSQAADVVTVYMTKHGSASGADFKITSSTSSDSLATIHCSGSVSLHNFQSNASQWVKDAAIVSRQSRYFSGSLGERCISTFRSKVLYEAIFTRVVKYSSVYQSLVHLSVADNNLEGIGSFKLPFSSQTRYLAPPVFTDTLLHAAGFIANLAVGSEEVGICARVESVEISYRDIDYADSFTVYCSLLEVKGAILADSIALDALGKVVAVIRGMEFRRLRLSTFQQMLSRKSTNAEPPLYRAVKRDSLQLSTAFSTPAPSEGIINTPIESFGIPLNDVRATLKNIFIEVGGFSEKDIDYTKSLDELGVDSLLQIEIISRLTRTFPSQPGLDHHTLSECETLESLESTLVSILTSPVEITSLAEAPAPATLLTSDWCPPDGMQDNPVALHVSHENAAPLCMFHDGSGQVSMYARLGAHDRNVSAFFDPHFGSDRRPHSSIKEMAKYYVSLLPTTQLSSLIVGGKF